MENLYNRVSVLQHSYLHLLGRLPDWNGFLHYLQMPYAETEFASRIMDSDEYVNVNAACASVAAKLAPYEGYRRVLLFGAFGNGNLGDRIMANAVAKQFEADGMTICFAYSVLNSAPYPFPPERQLDASHLPFNMRVLSQFDALIIGGGGLLAHPHDPLWDPIWPYLVPIPYGLFSCGASNPLDPRLHNLVCCATVASARDASGQQALDAVHSDNSMLCPDPVMIFRNTNSAERIPSRGTLYILRGPLSDWHHALRQQIGKNDAVAVFEAHIDHDIMSCFDRVEPINSLSRFEVLVRDFAVVVSERFHGVILALMEGVPAYGITRDSNSQKMDSLLSLIHI